MLLIELILIKMNVHPNEEWSAVPSGPALRYPKGRQIGLT